MEVLTKVLVHIIYSCMNHLSNIYTQYLHVVMHISEIEFVELGNFTHMFECSLPFSDYGPGLLIRSVASRDHS